MRVLVAGAGLAGLQAAWLLRRKGHEVTVCEARDRVGGRVWSVRLGNGAQVERGGEFIFPSDSVTLGLCARLGLPVIPHGLSFFRRKNPDGSVPTAAYLTGVLGRLAADLSAGSTASVAELFESALGPGYAADAVFLRTATSMAADPRQVSAMAELGAEVAGRHTYLDHAYHVAGGNQQIAAALAARAGDDVRLECPVLAVEQGRDSVTFILHDGSQLTADAAVLAVPFLHLTELGRNFGWPEPVERALAALLMGTAVKASVPLLSGASPRGVQAGQRWWAWNSVAPGDDLSAPAATAFASTAHDIRRDQRADAPWAELIQRLRPDLQVCGAALVTDWEQEVWTRGSYTAPGLGWRPETDLAFNAPIGRTVLAGEHTAAARGTIDGALQSGQRAARLLAACFG